MGRRALLVGIDECQNPSIAKLSGAVADATAMRDVLARNEDGSPNYDCRLLVNPGSQPITRAQLRAIWRELFADGPDDALFFFSGHGTPTQLGGCLVTHDASPGDPGLPMNDLLQMANQSKAREVLLILDCCFSGSLGNPPNLQGGLVENQAQLREGVTILAASRPTEAAMEIGGQGVFTELVVGALSGGAADVRGRVSAAAIYAYVEEALGAWHQRPLYKSHANMLSPVRLCKAHVDDATLRELPTWFSTADAKLALAPSYEPTDPAARPEHTAVFKKLQRLRDAGLSRAADGMDFYYAALGSKEVSLTPLGQHYWRLAKNGRI